MSKLAKEEPNIGKKRKHNTTNNGENDEELEDKAKKIMKAMRSSYSGPLSLDKLGLNYDVFRVFSTAMFEAAADQIIHADDIHNTRTRALEEIQKQFQSEEDANIKNLLELIMKAIINDVEKGEDDLPSDCSITIATETCVFKNEIFSQQKLAASTLKQAGCYLHALRKINDMSLNHPIFVQFHNNPPAAVDFLDQKKRECEINIDLFIDEYIEKRKDILLEKLKIFENDADQEQQIEDKISEYQKNTDGIQRKIALASDHLGKLLELIDDDSTDLKNIAETNIAKLRQKYTLSLELLHVSMEERKHFKELENENLIYQEELSNLKTHGNDMKHQMKIKMMMEAQHTFDKFVPFLPFFTNKDTMLALRKHTKICMGSKMVQLEGKLCIQRSLQRAIEDKLISHK